MKKQQTLKENYDYSLPDEDIDGIKKVATSGMKKLLTVSSVLFLGLFLLLILLYAYVIAFSVLTAGAISSLVLWASIRNTNKSFDKIKITHDELTYKLRVYDDFMVLEKSGEAGLLMLHTSSLYDAASLGENNKYIVVSSGVYVIPIPKDLLAENSFFKYLHSLKGAKIKKPDDAPEVFVEPRKEAPSYSPCEVSASHEEQIVSPASVSIEKDAKDNTPPTVQNEKEDEDSTRVNSSEEFEAPKETSASLPYAYEREAHDEKNKGIKALGIITFALALASIFASLIITLISILTATSPLIPLLLISALPVSSLVMGAILFKKQEKYLKNILAGFLALTVIISIDPFDITVYNDGDTAQAQEYADSVAQELRFDIPEIHNLYYYTSDIDDSIELSADLDKEDFADFIEYTKSDSRFVFNIPNLYMGILPEYFRHNEATVSLIYNKTTNEYNTIPKDSGTYRMIYVAVYEYEDSPPYFRIFEYDVEYTTDFN